MNNINFDAGPFARNTNTLEVEPVIPFRISRDWVLVSRILVNARLHSAAASGLSSTPLQTMGQWGLTKTA